MSKLDMSAGLAAYTRNHQVAQACAYSPEDEPALRAVYATLEYAKRKSFEEAMQVPAIAIAVRMVAHSRRHAAGELFNPAPENQP